MCRSISRETSSSSRPQGSRRPFPRLAVFPVEGDFTETLRLPAALRAPALGFFPGSTIGNLLVPEAVDLLRTMAASLGDGSMLLIGVDRVKDPGVLSGL